ncbi:MAG: HD domain-containing protein [Thermomicrobiales bacterium]|nr:HD domain-containing protein [Thermomicrobiales bacterium]
MNSNSSPEHLRQTSATQLTPGTGFPVVAHLRDLLHDRIPLGPPELAILSTPPFLRLERIQQLGFVSRIWPGARHARYEHSIGVFHLARLAVQQLRLAPGGSMIADTDARTLAAAALLHDIGHYPFSHAIEELGPPVVSHEEAGRALITQDPVASILRDAWQVDPERVATIVSPGGGSLPPVDRLLRGILSGPLDVDKLDYLPRDALGCGVPYGGVDTSRLIDSLRIATPPDETLPRIVVDSKGVSPLHSLINARQEMFDNVYWHHTNRACMAMLLRAVQDALLAGAVNGRELTAFDDRSLMAALSTPEMPETTRRLVTALANRTIHKRAVEFSANAKPLFHELSRLFFAPDHRRKIEMAMTDRLRTLTGMALPDEAILVDIPKPERWRTDVWVEFEHPPVGFTHLMPWRDVVGLTDEDFKRYEDHRRLIRIVTIEPVRAIVRDSWQELLLPEIGLPLR